mgnify:CR=1 FL=1
MLLIFVNLNKGVLLPHGGNDGLKFISLKYGGIIWSNIKLKEE